jgi:DNA polymerase-2
MSEYTGWLLDLYAHPSEGVVLWLLGQDGKRTSFHQDFPVTFYAGGPFPRLRELWRFLAPKPAKLSRTRREDLYAGPQEVMEIRVASPGLYPDLFREVSKRFPDLTFYDADLALPLRYAVAFNVFPMARCRVAIGPDGNVLSLSVDDTPWALDPGLPRLRKLSLSPDSDPSHASPRHLLIRFDGFSLQAPLNRPRALLHLLKSILAGYDPDVILTRFGDTWLFAHLEELSQRTGIPFNPNRDPSVPVLWRKEVSFFNYGRAHYRGRQVHLRGRWHIDSQNCMTYGDYGLLGAIEQARMTGLPIQEVARRSPGAGIAAMQAITAMRRGVLVPYQHQKGEVPKTYAQLFRADRGGLVFQPLLGLYPNVAILDFISMYPSIMVEYNISPETVGAGDDGAWEIPELGINVGSRLGLVPETLRPLRDKRVALKRLLKTLDQDDPRRRRYKLVAKALKWLTVVAYGRLGYANSTFGRINAHEVVGHIGRQVLLQAKAIAEDQGFTVLHLYVDSLFLCRPDATRESDFQPLIDAIMQETKLPIEVEDVYHWMAFLGSRQNPNQSVANRFFGLAQSGEYKIRGLALRREDTPAFVANTQLQILAALANEADPTRLPALLPEVMGIVREKLSALKKRAVPLVELVVTQTLSRELDEYSVLSSAAIAAQQLQARDKTLKMGQRVRFIYTATGPGVFAWDLPGPLDPRAVDVPRYRELLFRAVHEILQALGVTEGTLRNWMFVRNCQITPEDVPIRVESRLFGMPGATRSLTGTRASPLFPDVMAALPAEQNAV